MPEPLLRIEGLVEFRRDLRAIDRKLPREINKVERLALVPTARKAGGRAPVRTGKLAASVRPFATARAAGLRSRLPYAAAQHWGGRVGRQHHTVLAPTLFAYDALRDDLDEVAQAIGAALEALARKHGFH